MSLDLFEDFRLHPELKDYYSIHKGVYGFNLFDRIFTITGRSSPFSSACFGGG